jgi:hypothetical protein
LKSNQSGVAGEYFVAAELSRRGYLASLTIKNTAGIDILASNVFVTRTVGIQVKTAQNRSRAWTLGEKAENFHSPNFFYVFVGLESAGTMPVFYVVPSQVVAAFVKQFHCEAVARGCKDIKMREFRDKEGNYLGRWDLLQLDPPQ